MGSLIGSLILEGVIRSGWPVTPLQGGGPSMAVLGPLCWCDVAPGQGCVVLSQPPPLLLCFLCEEDGNLYKA